MVENPRSTRDLLSLLAVGTTLCSNPGMEQYKGWMELYLALIIEHYHRTILSMVINVLIGLEKTAGAMQVPYRPKVTGGKGLQVRCGTPMTQISATAETINSIITIPMPRAKTLWKGLNSRSIDEDMG